MKGDSGPDRQDFYRREAMGAFAHELRTPLTSLRMVLDLARMNEGADGELVLDAELGGMLEASLASLEELADAFQTQSRLERGKLAPGPGPTDLSTAASLAAELLAPRIRLTGMPLAVHEGPWDAALLAKAIAGFAEGTNRAGSGSGEVRMSAGSAGRCLALLFESGEETSDGGPLGAEAGFSFFPARECVLAMGGAVEARRGSQWARIVATLPFKRERGQ